MTHGEIQIGDAIIGVTEALPPTQGHPCVWMITGNVEWVNSRLCRKFSGWKVTKPPTVSPDGKSILMHATDDANTTWIIQQKLTSRTRRNGALGMLAVLAIGLAAWQLAKRT